ncbi:MAG TPA: prepilin-type N-terminal cleavage/methylation domain-containing protein [Longimicrobiaceae bacterium]
MPTEKRMQAEGGFTLIEVLAAMLVLAIGLMGLQALGIGAARSIVRADFQSEAAAAATTAMEARQQSIRANPGAVATGESCDSDPVNEVSVCVRVETRTGAPSLPVGTARVTVRAIHPRLPQDTFTVTSYVYDPGLP